MTILYEQLGLTNKRTKGRNKRVMLACWWWHFGREQHVSLRIVFQMASRHGYRLCKLSVLQNLRFGSWQFEVPGGRPERETELETAMRGTA
jgi:hypothetical protein